MQLFRHAGRLLIYKLNTTGIMKQIILTTSLFLVMGTAGFAQEQKVSTMKIYRVEAKTPEQKTELTKEEELKKCYDLLEALDVKEAWIRSNPEELKIATESGWFEDAEKTRAELHAKIKELESK
jgi:hypothetical protein